jgi:hypothetical protein
MNTFLCSLRKVDPQEDRSFSPDFSFFTKLCVSWQKRTQALGEIKQMHAALVQSVLVQPSVISPFAYHETIILCRTNVYSRQGFS